MLMTATSLMAIAGTFGIGLIIGLVVLTSAEEALTAVAKTAARDVSGSFWMGLLFQLLAAPLLVALVIGCAITIIGILVIPMAVLAWAMAYAGAFTLGILAVAVVIGRALAGRGSSASDRAAAVRSLIVGLSVLSVVWFGAALAAGVPVAGMLTRLVAVAFTWAVATVGLGAVVKSRVGVTRFSMRFTQRGSRFVGFGASQSTTTTESPAPLWQTPTPVLGVVAARRPVAPPINSNTGDSGES